VEEENAGVKKQLYCTTSDYVSDIHLASYYETKQPDPYSTHHHPQLPPLYHRGLLCISKQMSPVGGAFQKDREVLAFRWV